MTGVVKDDGVNFFFLFIIISNFSLVDVDKKKKKIVWDRKKNYFFIFTEIFLKQI